MEFLKVRMNFIVGLLLMCFTLLVLLLALLMIVVEYDKRIIAVKFEDVQLERLKELSKQDFRDVEHTMLMLVNQYIEYNNGEKK
jgi:hypothetical protein